MTLPIQIPDVAVSRAANAVHYEYMKTILCRTEEHALECEIWRRTAEEYKAQLRQYFPLLKRWKK